MKLLLVTDGITPFTTGGMQKHSANLAKWLTKKGVEVMLLHSVPCDDTIPSEEEVNKSLFGDSMEKLLGVITLHFPVSGKIPGHYVRSSKLLSQQFYEKVKDSLSGYDFIYGKGFATWYFLEQKKRGVKMPPIGVKFHGYEMFQAPPSLKVRIKQSILRKPTIWNNVNADIVFNYGGKITSIIKKIGVPENRIISIPTGIDNEWIREEITPTNEIKRFVFIGRFERRKGVQEIQYAINELIKKDFNFRFDFIGPIPKEMHIESDRVVYNGTIKDKEGITAILDKSDVLVCPSYSEGMPNVIMEGMARGLAVLATDVGAVSVQVGKENGWLLPKADKNLLLKSMEEIILESNQDVDKKKNQSIRKLNEKFRWEVIAQQTKEKISNYLDGLNR